MQVALICGKCGKIHANSDEGTLVVDFYKKEISFICQNKQCKFDNIFSMNAWKEKSLSSALPRMRTL